jgi:hypothetical protein
MSSLKQLKVVRSSISGEGGDGAVLRCHVDVDDVEGDAVM